MIKIDSVDCCFETEILFHARSTDSIQTGIYLDPSPVPPSRLDDARRRSTLPRRIFRITRHDGDIINLIHTRRTKQEFEAQIKGSNGRREGKLVLVPRTLTTVFFRIDGIDTSMIQHDANEAVIAHVEIRVESQEVGLADCQIEILIDAGLFSARGCIRGNILIDFECELAVFAWRGKSICRSGRSGWYPGRQTAFEVTVYDGVAWDSAGSWGGRCRGCDGCCSGRLA